VLRIAIDARDASADEPRGWQRYTIELLRALRGRDDLALRAIGRGWPGPEVLFEQVGLPLAARGAQVLHAPNCFLPLRRPCPGVVTIHDLAFEQFPEDFAPRTRAKFRFFTPRAARSAQRVIVPSAFTRDDVCERYGVPQEKVRVIGEGPALARGDASPPPGPYLLGVGDLRAKKNWLRLVSAWRTLRREHDLPHRLVIAGADSGEGERLRAEAAGEPLELPGYVDDARLDALMRGADALVHPSLYEGFGLVVVEAGARGVPVAASNSTALAEASADAHFDPLDPDDIARGILAALAARREPREVMSWAEVADRTVAVYREAARA